MIKIICDPIDSNELIESVGSPLAGASVLFLGTTRQFTGEQETAELNYECYEEMALRKMQDLVTEAKKKWPLVGCSIIHRIGLVPIGEASVGIATSSPHRKDAFAAGEWLIDSLKKDVPIWKQETFADGQREWIHPSNQDSVGSASDSQ